MPRLDAPEPDKVRDDVRTGLAALRERGVRQVDIAERLGVTQAFVSQLSHGRRSVPDAVAAGGWRLLDLIPDDD